MNADLIKNESHAELQNEYYKGKRLNVFTGSAILGSALINIGIIIYAVVCALMA